MTNNHLKFPLVSLLFLVSVILGSCTSTTMIQSTPSGAKVFINGEVVGTTPYPYQDNKIIGNDVSVRLEKQGYQAVSATFSRDEKVNVCAVVGGCLFLVPFLWAMDYKPTHSYELKPIAGALYSDPVQQEAPARQEQKNNGREEEPQSKQQAPAKSKADRLREIKKLLDDKILTQEEYDREKKKILDEPDY